ncbi:MAG TPA: hypothetical protein DDX04_07085 [Massilia sp.]|nr:hypothetical protein [Massilia sp.]
MKAIFVVRCSDTMRAQNWLRIFVDGVDMVIAVKWFAGMRIIQLPTDGKLTYSAIFPVLIKSMSEN